MGKTHDSVFSEYPLKDFPMIIISLLTKVNHFFHILQKKQPVPVFSTGQTAFFLKLLRGISHYFLNCLIIQTVCLFKTLIINKILYAFLHEILSFPLQPHHLMQNAIRFGNAINALKISAIFHTAATVIYGPINTARIYRIRYPFTTALFLLNRYSTHLSP